MLYFVSLVICVESQPGQDVNHNLLTRKTTFTNIASTLTTMNIFKTKIKNKIAQSKDEIVADPVLNVTSKGKKYWSILQAENSAFLEKSGFYDGPDSKGIAKLPKASGTMSMAAATSMLRQKAPPAKLLMPPLDVAPKQEGMCSTVISMAATSIPRSPYHHAAESLLHTGGIDAEVSSSNGRESPVRIPTRFLTGPRITPPLGLSGNFNFVTPPPTEGDKTDHDGAVDVPAANGSEPLVIPSIEINNNVVVVRTSSSGSSRPSYEWHMSSCSSTSTDDSGSPVDPSIFVRVSPRIASKVNELSSEDLGGGLLLPLPSDAASTISSHTLRENADDAAVGSIEIHDGSFSENVGGEAFRSIDRVDFESEQDIVTESDLEVGSFLGDMEVS